MKRASLLAALLLVLLGLSCVSDAHAAAKIGAGDSSLLGGDLTDPADKIQPKEDCGGDLPEEELKPANCGWVKMKCAPANPPGTPAHQRHPYQSWVGSPTSAIFWNTPEGKKWYVGFKDGGNGGPTKAAPFYAAVQFKSAYVLTHFTLTTSPDMPDRDPKSWAIQGSNSGKDDDWTDIYVCDAASREASPFAVYPRNETTLFTSFTTDDMAKVAGAKDAKKIQEKLEGKKLTKADFARPKAYTWFRFVCYSCFNPNTMAVANPDQPPGFSLGQMELFGVSTDPAAAPAATEARRAEAKPETVTATRWPQCDVPFMISYWCGPPKAETTLERYKELAECGFNVAYPAIDNLWEPGTPVQEEHNRKYLDVCRQAGLKALVWDGNIPKGDGWKEPKPEEIPQIEKALDGIIARYSSHPALLGYVVIDEPGNPLFPRIGVINQYLLKKDPKHLPYINLLPAYAFNPRSPYEEHVSKFIEIVKPALVSWDHYRQMFEGGDESTYWYNLEQMRAQCTKAGIPYNQIIVSMKHMGYRECSEVDLRWQVYTSLAYGSRGIQYFTYWYVKELAWAEAPALITKDGRRDVKWDYVKKINHRIAKLGPTLVKLTCTGAYCTNPVPPGAKRLSPAVEAPVLKGEGGAMVIGCFKAPDGKQYIFPVNRSFGTKIRAKLTLNEKIASAAEISQESGQALPATEIKQQLLEVSLEPGEGKLFLLAQ